MLGAACILVPVLLQENVKSEQHETLKEKKNLILWWSKSYVYSQTGMEPHNSSRVVDILNTPFCYPVILNGYNLRFGVGGLGKHTFLTLVLVISFCGVSQQLLCRNVTRNGGHIGTFCNKVSVSSGRARWFKYDRDWLCVKKSQFLPVIFEPPCTLNLHQNG